MISHVAEFDQFNLFLSLTIGLAAGFIKGLVGFAMPMILLSGLTFMVSADAALAALILPTFFSNIQQSMVNGISSTINSIGRFKMFLSTGGLFLMLGALLTPYIPSKLLLGILGCLIVFFSLLQVNGPKFKILEFNSAASAFFAAFAGFFGGISGVWGPPVVAYLTALNMEKKEQIQIQSVIYGLGAALLLFGHLLSGIFSWETAPLSAILVAPALLGVWLGTRVRNHFDHKTFRSVTLLVLLVAGLNLIRRALFG